MNYRLRKILGPGLSLILFAAAVWLLHNELKVYHLRDILHAFDAIPGAHLWSAAGLTILSYAVVTGYDWLAMRYIQYRLSYSKIGLASFIGGFGGRVQAVEFLQFRVEVWNQTFHCLRGIEKGLGGHRKKLSLVDRSVRSQNNRLDPRPVSQVEKMTTHHQSPGAVVGAGLQSRGAVEDPVGAIQNVGEFVDGHRVVPTLRMRQTFDDRRPGKNHRTPILGFAQQSDVLVAMGKGERIHDAHLVCDLHAAGADEILLLHKYLEKFQKSSSVSPAQVLVKGHLSHQDDLPRLGKRLPDQFSSSHPANRSRHSDFSRQVSRSCFIARYCSLSISPRA